MTLNGDAERIYQAYSRKVARDYAIVQIKAALVKLGKRKDIDDPVAWLMDRVEAYAKSPAGNNGKFTPHPSTWFHQGRYDDDPQEWQYGNVDKPKTPKELYEQVFNGDREYVAGMLIKSQHIGYNDHAFYLDGEVLLTAQQIKEGKT